MIVRDELNSLASPLQAIKECVSLILSTLPPDHLHLVSLPSPGSAAAGKNIFDHPAVDVGSTLLLSLQVWSGKVQKLLHKARAAQASHR